MTPIDQSILSNAYTLGFFATPLTAQRSQIDARAGLMAALQSEDRQAIAAALHELARSFRRGANGHDIPDRLNHTSRAASRLAFEIEGA